MIKSDIEISDFAAKKLLPLDIYFDLEMFYRKKS